MNPRYAKIKYFCTSNGDGIGTSIYLSGCNFHCKGCFNSSIWDHKVGKPFTDDVIKKVVDSLNNQHINHLSILGGEPLDDINKVSVYKLIHSVKNNLKDDKKIWIWSGYNFEILLERSKYDAYIDYILHHCDVLTDGQFEIDKKDLSLKYSGSTNQRTIDVQKSLKKGSIILYEKYEE